MEEIEIWTPVIGYEGYYECSNMGRIKTLERKANTKWNPRSVKGGIKSFCKAANGYLRVQFSKEGVNKTYPLHRIILSSFKGIEESRPFVNHINGIKDDNRLDNLEWCTHTENIRHSFTVLGRKMSTKMFQKGKENQNFGKGDLKPQCKKVLCVTLGLEFASIRKAGRELGINNANICAHFKWESKAHGRINF